jgi:DNA-binding NarL/FixJ family response regulator
MHKVLIVEDEDILRKAYVSVFTMEKFSVDEAENGQVAIEKIKKIQPDIVILDILMPVMDGLEFLQQIKLPQHFPKTKVLVLSNLSDKKTIEEAIKLGATKHVIKSSMSPSQLIRTVRSLLA